MAKPLFQFSLRYILLTLTPSVAIFAGIVAASLGYLGIGGGFRFYVAAWLYMMVGALVTLVKLLKRRPPA